MKKILIILLLLVSFWPAVANLQTRKNLNNAFAPGDLLDDVAGQSGAGYNTRQRSIDPIIGNIIFIIISFLGVIFLLLMIYGGFMWMTAMGDEKKVTKAKDMLTAAVIGLIVVVGAYVITYFIFINIAQPVLRV
jgi:hypothetical protein